jgi:hypothetical protein
MKIWGSYFIRRFATQSFAKYLHCIYLTKAIDMKKLFFLLILLFIVRTSFSQLNEQQVKELLTNGKSREWMFKEYKKTSGNECTGDGYLFSFLVNGKVQIKRCIDNKAKLIETAWSLQPVKDKGVIKEGEWEISLATKIEIENSTFKVMRIDMPLTQLKKKRQKMIWRFLPHEKAEAEERIILISNN